MVALREILTRFRPVTVPGAPVGGAVPGDRDAERDVELEAVFTSLDEVEAEVSRIRDAAVREAAAIRAEAARRAEAILQEASSRAPEERDRVVRQAHLETDEYCALLLQRSRARAGLLHTRAGPPAQAFAADVVDRVAAGLRTRAPGEVR